MVPLSTFNKNFNSWNPRVQPPKPPHQPTSWSPRWRNFHPGNQFPQQPPHQPFSQQQYPPQYPHPYQQSQLQLQNNVAPNMLIRPQLPTQPNLNPNNKVVHQFETINMPAYSLTHIPCNDIRLWSGKVVEPLIIKDVPSSMHEEGMNP